MLLGMRVCAVCTPTNLTCGIGRQDHEWELDNKFFLVEKFTWGMFCDGMQLIAPDICCMKGCARPSPGPA